MEKIPYIILSTNIDNQTFTGIIYLEPNLSKEQLEDIVYQRYYSRKARRRGVDASGFKKIVIKRRTK